MFGPWPISLKDQGRTTFKLGTPQTASFYENDQFFRRLFRAGLNCPRWAAGPSARLEGLGGNFVFGRVLLRLRLCADLRCVLRLFHGLKPGWGLELRLG